MQQLLKCSDFSVLGQIKGGICSIYAIAISTGRSEEEILKAVNLFTRIERVQKSGMSIPNIEKVLKHLGVRYEKRHSMTEKPDHHRNWDTRYSYIRNKITEQQFKQLPEVLFANFPRTFLVVNQNHAWVIKDRVTMDPMWNNPKTSKRRLTHVFEILS